MIAGKKRMIIKRAITLDAKEILALQKLAYISEAEIYNDFTIQPLHETLNEITSEIKIQYVLKCVSLLCIQNFKTKA